MEPNLLSDGSSKRHGQPACLFVLFGATGDLAAKKIAPALYNLHADGLLSENFAVVGVARRPRTDDEFRDEMATAVTKNSRQKPDPQQWRTFAARWHYHQLQADDPSGYTGLADHLAQLDAQHHTRGNRLFYLAMTPDTLPGIIEGLGGAGLSRPGGDGAFARVVVEKPFGHDLSSACELNERLLKFFREEQVYRIDHYLGKETVLNILALRFSNTLIEPMLNNRNVDHVQITAAETVGMEGRRGPYYEQAGALRDMVQNHLLQVLALTTMEPPLRLTADDIRNEKVKVLKALCPPDPAEVARRSVRGQYDSGVDAAGNAVAAYRQEAGVATDSQVETYAAIKLFIENWRWSGVPFYLRTGKRLAAKSSQIVVVFKRLAMDLFSSGSCDLGGPNRLIIRIHPDEGVSLVLDAKVPGPDMLLRPVKMDFRYESTFGWASPEAYEHLLLDAMLGDATLFIRNDEVEASWRWIDAIRNAWVHTGRPSLVKYPPFSWGPPKAQELFADPYIRWYDEA